MKIISLILLLLINFGLANSVHAQNSPAPEDQIPYSVEPVLPDNQVSDATYFDIEMAPGSTQELFVNVYNMSDQEIEVDISTNFAATNANGILTYDGAIEIFDESMEVLFDEIASVEDQTITVGPNDTEQVAIQIDIPEDGFDGQILGGIHFVMDSEYNPETEPEGGVGFVNEYSYSIGVNITEQQAEDESEQTDNLTVDEIDPELVMEDASAEIVDYRIAVDGVYANQTPILISQLNFHGFVTEQGEDEVLFEREIDSVSVGPNNQFHLPISTENQRIEPGEYTYHAVFENEDHYFEFQTDFSVSEELADQLEDESVDVASTGLSNWWLGGLIGVIIVLIILVIVLYRKLQAKE